MLVIRSSNPQAVDGQFDTSPANSWRSWVLWQALVISLIRLTKGQYDKKDCHRLILAVE